MVLERHGQNQEIKVLDQDGIENFARNFSQKLDWNSVQQFELAWTWEFYPLDANSNERSNGSLFLDKKG